MTAFSVQSEIAQEGFLSEILRNAILVPWMVATLDKKLPGESA